MKVEISINHDEIKQGESLICTFNIFNQNNKDIRNVILKPFVVNELSFVGGSVKRQRGIMDIEGEYINLEIGNLAPGENAIITMELKAKDNLEARIGHLPLEIKCYATVIFNNHNNIEETIKSNIVYTKIIGYSL